MPCGSRDSGVPFWRSEPDTMDKRNTKETRITKDTKDTKDTKERLQKILSRAGVASRRASEQLMLDGRVTVNGAIVRELGTKADPAHDDIRVDGRRVRVVERHRSLLLNKPRGCASTRSDPQQRPTVIDLLRG